MKLLSDFDGVWTNPRAEGIAQGAYIDRTLASWMPNGDRDRAVEWLQQARRATLREASQYGWLSEGRVSAYADEDPFILHSALLHYMLAHQDVDPEARALCEAVRRNGFDGLAEFGSHSHARAVEEIVRLRGPGILPEAAESGRELLASGVEVVLVSNSTPEKLLGWCEHANIPRTVHPDRSAGALRIRGASQKFVLGPRVRGPLEFGRVTFEIDRPFYEAILFEERPDAVAGDVFSLDLALPLALKRSQPEWSNVRLFWIMHPYTPEWLQTVVREHAPGEVEFVDRGLAGLARHLVPGVRP